MLRLCQLCALLCYEASEADYALLKMPRGLVAAGLPTQDRMSHFPLRVSKLRFVTSSPSSPPDMGGTMIGEDDVLYQSESCLHS